MIINRHSTETRRWTGLRAAAVLLVVCIPLLAGCGSGKFFVPTCEETNSCGGSSGSYSSYAYVANATIGTIAGFGIPTATFSSLTGATYDIGTPPSAVAGTPKGTFVYLATASGPIFVYVVGTNGALAEGNNSAAVATTLLPTYMTVDPSGNWLFVVSASSPQLLVFQINTSTGALTQSSQGTISLGSGAPTQVYVTPNNLNVFVGLGSGGLASFNFNASTGVLSNQRHYATRISGAADNSLAADNTSTFLFVGEAGSGIRVLQIGSAATLTEISGSPFATPLGPAAIVVDPTNSYVYVASRTTNVITGYSLASTGALATLPTSPFSTGSGPNSMSLDSTGTYLLVACVGGGPDLQVFSFDSVNGGELDSVTSTTTGTDPAGAISLTVVP